MPALLDRDVGPGVFRAATVNVWGFFGDWPARRALLDSLLGQLAADVLLVQEACVADGEDQIDDLREASGLEYAAVGRPHGVVGHAEGVGILSRWPLLDVRVEPLPRSEPARCMLAARLSAPAAPLWLVCAHTAFAPQYVCEEQIQMLAGAAGPVSLLGGDLNATPDLVHPIVQPAGYRDALSDLQATWPADDDSFRWAWQEKTGRTVSFDTTPRRLDYLLARGCDVTASGVIIPGDQQVGFASDHAVVWADVTLAGREDTVASRRSRTRAHIQGARDAADRLAAVDLRGG